MENTALIQMQDISKIYKMGAVDTVALNKVSISINRGEFIAIVGRSGCGKSTLLNIMGGMDNASEGDYYFDSAQINKLKGKSLARFRNRSIGFVFQAFNLVSEMSALNNVCMPLGYAGVSSKSRIEKAKEALEIVGLGHKEKNRPTQLSGGEQQRVAIARAIANNPDVILADEPTGNLDQKNSDNIMELLQSLHRDGKTIVMVTHDMELAKCADRVVKMADGCVVQ